MSRKITFEDGSAIEVGAEIVTAGEMATDAYRRLMDFIEAELVEADQSEHWLICDGMHRCFLARASFCFP